MKLKIKKLRWFVVGFTTLIVIILTICILLTYTKEKNKEITNNPKDIECEYKPHPDDLKYSDSIIISSSSKGRVYNLNTQSFMHDDIIAEILPFDTVPESKVVYVDNNYKRGYLNVVTGVIDIKAEYDHAWLFSEGIAAVVKDGMIGFIDKNNNVVIPFKFYYYDQNFPYTYRFYNGYCKITDEEGRCGLIDRSGNWVIEPKYQRIKRPVFNKYRKVKLNDKWGLLDENLKLILPIKYDHIKVLDSIASRFEVTYNENMYEINRQGKILKKLGYVYMHPFYDPKNWRYGNQRTSGRYMQVWVRQECEVDNRYEYYDLVAEDDIKGYEYNYEYDSTLDQCSNEFRSGIIDVIENRVIVPIKYSEITFEHLPIEIDTKKSLVFNVRLYSHANCYRTIKEEWITLDGKKVRIKYE